MVCWARTIRRPVDARQLADALIGVILSSGFSYERAMEIKPRVIAALGRQSPIREVCRHPLKANAIEHIWKNRGGLFRSLPTDASLPGGFGWCAEIPYIRGPILRFQALRDLGVADVAKPDRLMVRVAREFRERGDNDIEAVQSMCGRLARECHERVGTIDIILWFAASRGLIGGIRLRGRRPPCHGLPCDRPSS
jgi:hypothetical protein